MAAHIAWNMEPETYHRELIRNVTALLRRQGPDLGSHLELAVNPDVLGHDGPLLIQSKILLENGSIAGEGVGGSLHRAYKLAFRSN